MSNQFSAPWNDDRTAMVIKLQADGLSASQIAAELGGVTRSGVLGKLNRMGLNGKYARSPGGEHPPILRKPRVRRVPGSEIQPRKGGLRSLGLEQIPAGNRESANRAKRAQRLADAEQLRQQFACNEIIDLTPEQSATKCTLMELNGHTCRWPLGNPQQADFKFCGAKPYSNGRDYPYCAAHCRRAYRVRERA